MTLDQMQWYTIYHQLPDVIRGKQNPLLINQPMGKRHQCLHNLITPRHPQSQSLQLMAATLCPLKLARSRAILCTWSTTI